MAGQTQSPSEVLAAQLPKIRQRLGDLSGAKLSQRIEDRGGKLGRMAISKIENGQRGVSLDEALMLAAALGLAPVHLFTPVEDAEEVAITPELVLSARQARDWFRGRQPLPGGDEKTFRTEVPESEWKATQEPTADERAALERLERARRRVRVADKKLALVAETADDPPTTMELAGGAMGSLTGGVNRIKEQRLERAWNDVAEAEVYLEDAEREVAAIRRSREKTEGE